MEMKINFNQLFGTSNQLNTTQQTPLTPPQQSIRSLSDSFDYQLTLDPQLFPSFPDDYESSKGSVSGTSNKTSKGVKSEYSSNSLKSPQPGERLFYESQANHLRKIKERAYLQQKKQQQIKKIPFAPAINKKSRQMAERAKQEEFRPPAKAKKEEEKTSKQLKDEQELKQCTFQPKLISKTTKNITKSKEQLFYMLHSTSKIRQVKRLEKLEQEELAIKRQQKKFPEKNFDDFLRRNQQFAQISRKKLEFMKHNASLYDLKTGQKLWSPKISEPKGPQFVQNSPKKQESSPKTAKQMKHATSEQNKSKRSGIFSKKYPTYCPSYDQTNDLAPPVSEFPLTEGLKTQQDQQYNEQYKKYSEQYDRLMSRQEGSISHHVVIMEESQKQGKESEPSDWQGEEGPVMEDANIWGSAEVSNVKQYLAGSEEDQPEPKNNYVMDILSNLINSKAQADENQP